MRFLLPTLKVATAATVAAIALTVTALAVAAHVIFVKSVMSSACDEMSKEAKS